MSGCQRGFPTLRRVTRYMSDRFEFSKENVRIWCNSERTKDSVRVLPVLSLMMNCQGSSATGYSPLELFMGRPASFLHAPYPDEMR